MRKISVEKVTLNIGAGKDQTKLEQGIKLINNIAGRPPVKKKDTGMGIKTGVTNWM